FITDGGEEVRSLAEMIGPASEHVLDWFHITIRITVLRQFAQGETGNFSGVRRRAEGAVWA
ncbi:ISKra4 family transposase, partial [Mesorhizobium waimense]